MTPWLRPAIRLLVAFVFAAAAVGKLVSDYPACDGVRLSQPTIVDELARGDRRVVLTLVALELLLAAWLISAKGERASLGTALVVLS